MTFVEIFGSEKDTFDEVLDADFIETPDDAWCGRRSDNESDDSSEALSDDVTTADDENDDAARFLAAVDASQKQPPSSPNPPAPTQAVSTADYPITVAISCTATLSALTWERAPELESHVGVAVERAVCRWHKRGAGDIAIDVVAQLKAQGQPGPAGATARLRLIAAASHPAGNDHVWQLITIPPWHDFPPLYVVGGFRIIVSELPSRFMLYPEVY